jgi:GNAT superfamily N-acetyltransferase
MRGYQMQLSIIKNKKIDERELENIFQLDYEDVAFIHHLQNQKENLSFAAFSEDKLIGYLYIWKNHFHPHSTYFRILVHPFYQSTRVTEQLLAKLEGVNLENTRWQTSIWDSSHVLHVLKENGFNEVRKTYSPKLDLAQVKHGTANQDDSYELVTLKEISSSPRKIDNLIQLVKRNYEITHQINPPRDMNGATWKKLIFAEDLILEGSYLYLAEEEIIAYSLLHTAEQKDTLELGWCGSKSEAQRKWIPKLVVHQINYSMKQGARFLVAEIDTTDAFALTVFHHFPFAPTPAWITLQKSI